MHWLIVVPVVFAAWFFLLILPAGPRAIEAERQGIPEDERDAGVLIAPMFPLFPMVLIVLWAISNTFFAALIFWAHVVILSCAFCLAAYYTFRLRRTHFKRITSANSSDASEE